MVVIVRKSRLVVWKDRETIACPLLVVGCEMWHRNTSTLNVYRYYPLEETHMEPDGMDQAGRLASSTFTSGFQIP